MLIAVVIVLIVLCIVISMRPGTFRLERKATITAPTEKVFSYINDFREWAKWSPWEKMDLNMQKIYSGAVSGKGSIYEWTGNNKVGMGRMEITGSTPNRIMLDLDFLKPFEAHNKTEFLLAANGDTTEVTWTMSGDLSFLMKAMHLVMNMDKVVGKDFESGLAGLKALAEG